MHDDCTHFYIFGIHVFPLVFSCINFFMWAVVLKGGGYPPNPIRMRPGTRVLLRKGVIHPHGNSIPHLHISHNAPWLLPPPPPPSPQEKKLCITFVFYFSWVVPREIKDNADARLWGANKMYYRRCENGEF